MTRSERCQCMKAAVVKTVTRDSDNKGKTFWACRSRECSFFAWTMDAPKNWLEQAQEKKTKKSGCQCKQGPRRRQTVKEGKNKGRWFLSCEKCDFFQWDSPTLAQPTVPEEKPRTRSDFTVTVPVDWDWKIPYVPMYNPTN